MKTYTLNDAPLRLYGVPFYEKTGRMIRFPDELIAQMDAPQSMAFLGKRTPGTRVRFRTDAKAVTVSLTFATMSVDRGMSIYACQSAAVYEGTEPGAKFRGLVPAPNYETKSFSGAVALSGTMNDVTVYLPRNEQIENVSITVEDDAAVLPPTPYTYEKPVVFYGSSITEGGCCENVANAYVTLVSRRLNTDFLNLGFSGSARGELAVADFINTLDMSVLVYDYDHNAPTAEHLQKTHRPFFERIREKHPTLPVIMMTRPAGAFYLENPDTAKRREIIRATFDAARAKGDENVYFLDGGEFFPIEERENCLVDGTHPNDLGFKYMADALTPVLKKVLEK